MVASAVAVAMVAVYLFGRAPEAPPPPPLPEAPWIQSVENLVRDVDRSEAVASAIGGALKKTLIRGLQAQDYVLVRAALTGDFEARFPARGALTPMADGALVLARVPTDAPPVDAEGLVAALSSYLEGLSVVERASWRIYESKLDASGSFARVKAHLQLAGADAEGRRVQWYGSVDAEVVHRAGTWRMRRLAVVDGHWSESPLPPFVDVGPLVGFGFFESDEGAESVTRMIDARRLFNSGGLTVFDFDGDGFSDIIANRHYQASTLFMNDGAGGFSRRPLVDSDGEDAAAKMFLSVDLDDDGTEELVSTKVFGGEDGRAELGLYVKRGGELKRKRRRLRFDTDGLAALNYEALVSCDVNGDQRLDLLFLGYNNADSGKEAFSNVDGRDGQKNLLFINKGRLRFSEQSVARGLEGTQYSFVAECFDFDDDGDVDLFIGNDYGQNNYFANDGKGHFAEDPSHPFHQGRGFSMGLSMADYDNTGSMSVSISNMYSHAGNRIVPLVSDLQTETKAMLEAFAAGNTLFERREGTWVDVSADKRVAFAEWAWGNVFFDFDNDTDKDLFVANGFTTHSDPTAPDF